MYKISFCFLMLVFAFAASDSILRAQENSSFEVVSENSELEQIVPESFYFAGLSGKTQRRNSAVAKLGEKRFIVAGLVDVSGYSTEISGVYEGFFITDSNVKFGKKKVKTGAYGFGFAKDGTVNLFDLSGKKIITVKTTRDDEMSRPRPLMMMSDKDGVKLFKGRDFVLVRPR
ncbi:MAG: hypothetical protein OEM82_08015 [Acidobacteriota bacterium]|nr:hypothetical protein [Acidobacteriota bacterium]MDH3528368.1 hypothetical protein [Acidobacteriota bacterium]